jgi:hypothetical protein
MILTQKLITSLVASADGRQHSLLVRRDDGTNVLSSLILLGKIAGRTSRHLLRHL